MRERETKKERHQSFRIKKLERQVADFQASNKRRRVAKEAKYKGGVKTDIGRAFVTLVKDVPMVECTAGLKLLDRLGRVSSSFASVIFDERENLRYSCSGNGSYIIVEVYGKSINRCFGLSRRYIQDSPDDVVGLQVALRRALQASLSQQI